MGESISYRRWRFSTDLPAERRYTTSHFWLAEKPEGVWRVGLTKFATWLLGDPVECQFKAAAGSTVAVGQEIGWVEGLKSLTTIYSAAGGELLDCGTVISENVTLFESDPYERGWLYRVRGVAAPDSVNVHGYIAILDEAVDEVMRRRQDECGGECEG
jgi:glycine cleavage system H protein